MLRKLGDMVHVAEDGFARLRNRAGAVIAGRPLISEMDKPIVEVKGWVTACLRERGKKVPGSHREGHNIWTNTGREYLAMLMSLQSTTTPMRRDSMAYIGVGTGVLQVEDAGVITLETPVPYAPALFLADLEIPPTFPLLPTRTTVRYHRTFTESEITLSVGSKVFVSELGLFTNGDPESIPPWNPGSRNTEFAFAGNQNPMAYKRFDPLGKTDALELEVAWEIRF